MDLSGVASRLDAIIDELREYEEYLASELVRTRRAIAAIADDEQSDSKSEDGLTTNLRDVLEVAWPAYVDAPQLSAEMLVRGWRTDSKDPTNTVRAALARMVGAGEVERDPDRRGRYRLRQLDGMTTEDEWIRSQEELRERPF